MACLRKSARSAVTYTRWIVILTAVSGVLSGSPSFSKTVAPSKGLCAPQETAIFVCPVGRKLVSVCGQAGKATYRFGSPGKVELSSQALTTAERSFSGGGETQIQLRNGQFTYLVYDKTVRTSFSSNGRNDPDFTSGLVVLKDRHVVSARKCGADASISAAAGRIIPAGGFIEH